MGRSSAIPYLGGTLWYIGTAGIAVKKVRILIVDDHQVVRKGVAAVLAKQPHWEICGEASTGREALAACARWRPDVVVMDISMPDMNGLEATRQILKNNPRTQILVLSMHDSEQLVREVLATGARGYVLKGASSNELVQAVEALANRRPFLSPVIGEIVLRGYLDPEAAPSGASELSPREREIVQLVAEGKSNKEVAGTLGITVKTVETHRARIMKKLGLHSIADLVRYAIRNRIIEG